METKELLPEYVLQPHAISRAAYRLSATARKIIAMGMSILPPDLSSRSVTFSFYEFCQALGYERGGESQKIFLAAVDECIGCVITIETAEEIRKFTWVQIATYNKITHLVTLEFSVGLTDYLLELKKMYARIDLINMGKLQSLYALRYYELAKSYESLAGLQGNRQNCWYFERTIEELRKILDVEPEKYLKTNDFKKRVIEGPIMELNEANLGFYITVEYLRRGRNLVGVRFLCEKNIRKVGKKQQKGIPVEAPTPIEAPETLEEKELAHLMNLYPQEYAELYNELLNHPPSKLLQDMPRLWEKQAQREAQKILKDRHGIKK
jgi:hypothetical protein